MDTKITNGGGSFLQNISSNYNERGWLLGSSAPLFEMQLQYNNITGVTGITPMIQNNGNIASQSWGASASPNTKSYTYTYDNLNRLTSGISTDNFSESGITYDLNGNILKLQRTYGSTTPIDNLVYTYNGTNQVQSINDLAPDNSHYGYRPGLYNNYRYDVNGNMTVLPTPPDGNPVAGIDIQYNLLNLPQTITGGKTITYTYDATGNKLRRVSPVTGSTDYINGIQYDQAVGATAPTLSFIQTEEGKAAPLSTGGYDYYYYMDDNLGNTRITFDTKAGTAVVLQQDDYLPFGYEISRNTVTSPKNEYLYNKKELQEELAEYDYGRRFYDPVIARWNTIDPLAERHTDLTPYNYVMNNPLMYGDELGMDTTKVHQLKEVKITATKTKKADEDPVGTNLFHHTYKPAPLPPCNCPLFKQAATFTAVNLAFAALGEYLSRFGLFADEAGEISQEVKNIGPQKWIKIMNASHAWNKVAVSQADIEAIVSKTLQSGADMPYGNTGLMSKVMYNNGEVIQVVKAEVNGQTVVSNAWVITDPAYKTQALRAILAGQH